MKTKERILKTAIDVFNKYGYNSISFQELANYLKISRGNLTYHFKDKGALLKSISNQMWIEFDKEKQKTTILPSFENIYNEIKIFHKLQRKYSFIFLNTHLSSHPVIKSKFKDMMLSSVEQNKATILFSIQIGNFKPEAIHGTYNNLAFSVWMVSNYWFFQQRTFGEDNTEDAGIMVWSLLLPYFTEKGLNAFKKYFGIKYYKNIGLPFESNFKIMNSKI